MARDIKINMDKLRKLLEEIENNGGISLREICRKMNVNESYLTKVKLGEFKQISLERLGRFCRVMDLNPYDYVEGGDRIINLDTLPADLAEEIWELILRRAARSK